MLSFSKASFAAAVMAWVLATGCLSPAHAGMRSFLGPACRAHERAIARSPWSTLVRALRFHRGAQDRPVVVNTWGVRDWEFSWRQRWQPFFGRSGKSNGVPIRTRYVGGAGGGGVVATAGLLVDHTESPRPSTTKHIFIRTVLGPRRGWRRARATLKLELHPAEMVIFRNGRQAAMNGLGEVAAEIAQVTTADPTADVFPLWEQLAASLEAGERSDR